MNTLFPHVKHFASNDSPDSLCMGCFDQCVEECDGLVGYIHNCNDQCTNVCQNSCVQTCVLWCSDVCYQNCTTKCAEAIFFS